MWFNIGVSVAYSTIKECEKVMSYDSLKKKETV